MILGSPEDLRHRMVDVGIDDSLLDFVMTTVARWTRDRAKREYETADLLTDIWEATDHVDRGDIFEILATELDTFNATTIESYNEEE